ncbi:FHA domain-containing protein [Acidimicrobiia bacterium EGI L10123]|uniref:FHA domain-containing protein n=1 Tax=Salinilacustrithrix flava TaxID=2957203 RepID=UPI003D7C2A3E|nr:FHA domain-containing protein [Acidimicrobiia bacterium EGI L10123]
MSDHDDAQDLTGVLPIQQLRLSDLLDGDPPLPHAVLVVLSGPARGTTLVVGALPAEIGRAPEADLVLEDDTVSRHHAVLRGDRGGLELEDLGSSNGTNINGNPMAGALSLLDGDLVTFGSATCLVKRIG